MNIILFYSYLRRQIPVMIFLSLVPGIAYVVFGYINDIFIPALGWYILSIMLSIWGYKIYKNFDESNMSKRAKKVWYKQMSYFFYAIFNIWLLIFLLYVIHHESHMHYIAIFTELGASVVAATLLFPDKRLFIPIIATLMLPLSAYFFVVGTWYTYLLSVFSLVYMGVLYYSANSSYTLIHKTNYQASHDPLTNLFNRETAVKYLQETINSLRDKSDSSYIFLLDLDHFKIINDTLGHDIGDLLLKEVASRMQKVLAKDHYIARLGGDEFIIICHEHHQLASVLDRSKSIAEQLLQVLREIYDIDQHQLYISASIGISLLDDPSRDAHEFIKEADIAMYEAKSAGKDSVFFFDHAMSEKIQRQLELEKLLPFALEKEEFYLQFQPQMSIDGDIIGCEALARWHNKTHGTIPPNEFIALAEQSTQVISLGLYLMEKAFKTFAQWDKDGLVLEQFSVNLSIKQIFSQHFISDVLHLSEKHLKDHLRHKVIFEITESVAAGDIDQLILIINKLKEYGFRFSLDDFGTGYSSLSYLRQIPIDELKIDRSFISELSNEGQEHPMIDAIFTMAKSFKYSIVAEGVEEKEQLELLKQYQCDIIQGYLFSKPLDYKAFESFYHQRKKQIEHDKKESPSYIHFNI